MLIIIFVALVMGFTTFIVVDFDAGAAGLLAAGMGALVGAIVATIIGTTIHHHVRPVERVNLVSLADGAGVEGHFFLGSGAVGDTQNFTWYESSGKNSFVRKSADAQDSAIHYVEDKTPPYYVRSADCSSTTKTFTLWAINTWPGCYDSTYDFYIPKGSIVQDYTLDNR